MWVQARSAGATDVEAQAGINFEVTTGSGGGGGGGGGGTTLTGVSLTPAAASPQPTGVPIMWTAAATGGTAPLAFRFWVQPWNGSWAIVRDWAPANTFTWQPTVSGGYNVAVEARSAGSTTAQVQATANFVVSGP